MVLVFLHVWLVENMVVHNLVLNIDFNGNNLVKSIKIDLIGFEVRFVYSEVIEDDLNVVVVQNGTLYIFVLNFIYNIEVVIIFI